MPQLHLSVDEQTAKRIQREAKRLGMTVSKYLAMVIARDLGDNWPPGYLDRVIGSCADSPISEPSELPLDDVEVA